jgi:hypothetical protein
MRHTNLSSAVQHAKKLAKEKGKSHYANGSRGNYSVSDKRPEDSSFVQATPSGGEWSHKMNQATKAFTKSRIFGGTTMEDVEREWGQGTMRGLIERLESLHESMSRHCEIYKAKNGKWYLDLAPKEDGERQDADTYGPFPSENAADKYLDRFSNPGSLNIDDSGDRPVPKKSPNGSHVKKPGSRMWESARPQTRAMKNELQDMFKPNDMDKVVSLYLKHRNSVDKFVDAALRAKIGTRDNRRTYEQEWHDIWFALRAVE